VHRLLRISPMKDFQHMNKSEWFGFLLFDILDHICTMLGTCSQMLRIKNKATQKMLSVKVLRPP
jgi:hypothetical protein